MPKYLYRCARCGAPVQEVRAVADRRANSRCLCGGEALFEFTSLFGLITNRECDQAENKYALGFSETDRTAQMKRDDATYESNWAGADTSAGRHVTPSEALTRMPLASIFGEQSPVAVP